MQRDTFDKLGLGEARKTIGLAALWLGTIAAGVMLTSASALAETYFAEGFEGANAPDPKCWWQAANPAGYAEVTTERPFSGKCCAIIHSKGNSNWEILLPKPLKWDRKDPKGIGNQPLFLSARIYAVGPEAEAHLGFRISLHPKRHPATGRQCLEDRTQLIAGRSGRWLHLCFDVAAAIREAGSTEGGSNPSLNPDHVVLDSISLYTCTAGTYYLDDVRLSTERPAGCTPPLPLPKFDVASSYRSDPELEGMVLHGAYRGVGSAIAGDSQLHANYVRDMKRHYLNFVFGYSFGVKAEEPQLRIVERLLDQAAQYDMPCLPLAEIGDRHAGREVKAWSDEKLHAEMLKLIRRFKNKSHLFGWYLEEEAPVERAAICLKQKRWVEEEDPSRSVWNVFNVGPPILEYGPAYSVMAIDHYPIIGANPNPWAVPRHMGEVATKLKQPCLLVDQIFAGGGRTEPTLGQWRLMAYGAMAEGAKGFFHFLYFMDPLYRMRGGERLHRCMVDVYGTPSPIYQEIERHLGPDLFSFGELLRTCWPADVPPEIRMDCGTLEDAQERELPAIALRQLTDASCGYSVLAMYSNDPEKTQSGTLHIPAGWLRDRIIMDLNAHSSDILRQTPIRLVGEKVHIQLEPGDGRFLAIVEKALADQLVRRMQARRFEVVRKMVEFDCRWLGKVNVGPPFSDTYWADLQHVCNEKSPSDALREVMRLDDANQALIRTSPLAPVLRDLDVARQNLSASCDAIARWATPQENGKPFPPDVAPGKSYCEVQDKLGELFVGFSDLAYSHTPEPLTQPVAEFAALCAQHAEQLKKTSGDRIPAEPCHLSLDAIRPLERQLHALGWKYVAFP
jgi:hypothetical protein